MITLEQLRAVAAALPKPKAPATNGRLQAHNGSEQNHKLDIPKWLTARGVGFRLKDRQASGGRDVYLLDQCPFNPEHGKNGDVAIMQDADGKLSATCYHDSCSGKHWQEF